MKKILSAILVATMFIACFGLTANAAISGEEANDEAGVVNFELSDSCVDGVLTLTYKITFVPAANMDNGGTLFSTETYFDPSQLSIDLVKSNATSTIYVDGVLREGALVGDEVMYPADGIGYIVFAHMGEKAVVGSTYVVTFNMCFNVLVEEETEITFGHYALYGFAGAANPEFVEDYAAAAAPAAPAAPEYTKPATPGAQIKAACEACGTEAGVRFLMTINKAAADFTKVTAYGVVIEANGKEYKYTAGANTKMNVTDKEIQYAVVVTGAPAGTEFTATAFFMYGNTEVAGDSGAIKA